MKTKFAGNKTEDYACVTYHYVQKRNTSMIVDA